MTWRLAMKKLLMTGKIISKEESNIAKCALNIERILQIDRLYCKCKEVSAKIGIPDVTKGIVNKTAVKAAIQNANEKDLKELLWHIPKKG